MEAMKGHLIDFIISGSLLLIGSLLIGSIVAIVIATIHKSKEGKMKVVQDAVNKDTLTGLPLSIYSYSQMINLLEQAEANEYEVISIDIDKFSAINKYYGSQKGTQMIQVMAESLLKVFKDEIKSGKTLITRYSAEQFYILRPNEESKKMIQMAIVVLREMSKDILGPGYNLSLSIGVYKIQDPKEVGSSIFRKATLARKKGKLEYTTTIINFNEAMEKEEENKFNVVYRMQRALEDGEFYIKYRPKINLKTQRICGAEASVRWQPKLTNEEILPEDFIPVFENNGFITKLDVYVFEAICRLIKTNHNHIYIPTISIKVSGMTILDKTYIPKILAIMENYDVKATEIELEITESMLVTDQEEFLSAVQRYRNLGFKVILTNFGMGISTINHIRMIEANILKIDKALINNNGTPERTEIVVQNMLQLAKRLDMQTLVEGVETAEQVRWLQKLGCDRAQGDYFSEPLSEEAFKLLLEERKQYAI